MNTVPMVVRRTPDGERAMDIASLLLQDRVVSFSTEVNDASAELVMMQLLYLDSLGNDPIKLYINSPGGSVSAGFAVHDTMKMLKSPVWTVGTGICASMGAFLLASGDKRLILENAEVMIHQPLGGMRGQASDMEIHAAHIKRTKEKLNGLLARYTGQPLDVIEKATDRDNFLTAKEALEFGLVDEILTSTKGGTAP